MIDKGIIVSIQGYHQKTIEELSREAIKAGAVAIRTDKPLTVDKPIIGLQKMKVSEPEKEPYITSTIDELEKISKWANYVAVDYRKLNPKIKELSEYARANKIKIVADIGLYDDYKNIKENNYYYDYIATTFSVFFHKFNPDIRLVKKLLETEKNIIAEGNYFARDNVRAVYDLGCNNVCIGGAISDVYKLTRRFTTICQNI